MTRHQGGRPRVYTDTDLIVRLQERAVQLGHVPRMCDFGSGQARTYVTRFGSWANAVERAGFPRPHPIGHRSFREAQKSA